MSGLWQIAFHPERDPCNNCLCRCKQFGSNCSKPVVYFKNQSKNDRVNPPLCYYIALNLVPAKVFFCWCNDSDCLFVRLFCDASVVLYLGQLPGVKVKNKQIEPAKASRDIFRDRLKQFWTNLLPIASFPFFWAISRWACVWGGSSLP